MSDDFEFKPLTEGLGFHKKVIELKDEMVEGPMPGKVPQRAPATSMPLTGRTQPPLWKESLPKHDFKEPKLQPPLRLVPVAVAWPGAIFDCAMILGMALIFSAAVFTITKIDLSQLIEMLRTDGAAQWAAFFILFCVFEIYTVACRTFFGKTLGEWVFDYRLGTPANQERPLYPLQVAARSLIMSMTGFIIFPVINTLFGEDLLGKLTGVSLFMEKR